MELRAGLQKLSLIDYPGRVACVLFLPGCNFACPYCHNPELARGVASSVASGVSAGDASGAAPELSSFGEVLAHVRKRKGVITGCVVSGGEPLIHETVPWIVEMLHAEGMLVKLDTNGSFPERIAAAGADYVAMDIKTSPERYAELWPGLGEPGEAAARIERSVEALRSLGMPYEFRITCAPGFVTPETMDRIAGLLRQGDPVFLQAYRPGRVLDQAWADGAGSYTGAQMEELLAAVRKASPKARIRAA